MVAGYRLGLSLTKIMNPVEQSIRNKLFSLLNTTHLDVINESYMHNVPKGSETHFKVVVVSDKFSDLSLIKVIFNVQSQQSVF